MSDAAKSLVDARRTPAWQGLILLVASIVLALYVAAPPPFFSPDAANYIYAGHSWSVGQVDTTAHKIGSRVYVVAAYFFPQKVLGVSIDTLSVTLATLALLTFVIVLAWVRLVVSVRSRFWVGLATIFMAAFWMEWDRALTENLFAPLAFSSLLAFDLSRGVTSPAATVALLAASAAVCGIAFGVRPEALFLFASLWLAVAVCFWGQLKLLTMALTAMVLLFATLATLPPVAFHAFSGKQMPYQIKEYFLFYRSVAYFGDRTYGPASAELHSFVKPERLATLAEHEILPVGLAQAIGLKGPEYASKLYGKAGVETLRADFSGVAADTVASFGSYLFSTSGRFRLETARSFEERSHAMEAWLAERDELISRRPRFEGPAPWRFSQMISSRLPIAPGLEFFGRLPPVRIIAPPILVTVLMVVTLLVSFRRRDFGNTAAAACMFFVASIALASFSQGFLLRYWTNASLVCAIACIVYLVRRSDSPPTTRSSI